MPDPTPKPAIENEPPAAAPEKASSQGGTAVKESPKPARPRIDFLPQYRVLLHNDHVNPAEEVVDTIIELTPIGRQRAVVVMLEAHTTGVALVLVTHKERAELYREQFRSKRLTVTIEAAE
jgi:ATP-dependent Clp protease adaptor protein ClpS